MLNLSRAYRYQANGVTIDFAIGDGKNYVLNQPVGVDGVPVTIETEPRMDGYGVMVRSERTESRPMTLEGYITGDNTEALKKNLRKAFVPGVDGTLFAYAGSFESEEGSHKISCRVVTPPVFSADLKNPKFQIQLMAPYPYWSDVNETAIINSNAGTSTTLVVNNDGDIPAEFRFNLVVLGAAAAASPYIRLPDGRTIRYNGQITAGKQLWITTTGGVLNAYKIPYEPVNGNIDVSNLFMRIPVGSQNVTVGYTRSGTGTPTVRVEVRFYKESVGVG